MQWCAGMAFAATAAGQQLAEALPNSLPFVEAGSPVSTQTCLTHFCVQPAFCLTFFRSDCTPALLVLEICLTCSGQYANGCSPLSKAATALTIWTLPGGVLVKLHPLLLLCVSYRLL